MDDKVHLYNARFEHKFTYPFDASQSALATVTQAQDNQKLTRFRMWLGRLFCFRLNPFAMDLRAEGEDSYPKTDLTNIAAWYRHLLQSYPIENQAFIDSF